jgi:purine-binding chemotaxis protein CheW
MQYLTFTLAGQCYGVQIATVREINRLVPVSPVPHVPDFVAGVMNLRGKVVPVVELGLRFGFGAATRTKETCVIVIEGSTGQVGTIVDGVTGVADLDATQVEPAPALGDQRQQSFVRGIGKADDKVIILVDVVDVLAGVAA